MKLPANQNWKAVSALGAVAIPFGCLKLGYVLSRAGVDLGIPIGVVLAVGLGGLCAMNVPTNRSSRFIVLAAYIPVVLILLIGFAITFDRSL